MLEYGKECQVSFSNIVVMSMFLELSFFSTISVWGCWTILLCCSPATMEQNQECSGLCQAVWDCWSRRSASKSRRQIYGVGERRDRGGKDQARSVWFEGV